MSSSLTSSSLTSSLLGEQHLQRCQSMTWRAAVATMTALVVLSLACSPLLLALPVVLCVYIASEAVFVVIYWYRYLLLSYQPIKHRPLIHDPIAAWQRTLIHLQTDGADIRAFLSIWFHGAPFSRIKRENVKSLIAYAFWYKTPAEVAAEGRAHELEQQVAMLESMWGLRLQPGYDPELTCMCHLWEPMKHWYRPLAFYVAMEAAALLCRVALQAAGFERHVWNGLAYYTRNMPARMQPRQSVDYSRAAGGGSSSSGYALSALQGSHSSSAGQQQAARHYQWQRQHQQHHYHSSVQEQEEQEDSTPLVLLHGIGMGLLCYISVLFNLAATGRPVLALEMPHISQRWCLWVPTLDETTEVLLSILNRSDIQRCCVVGHSYGSAVASRLLQQAPGRIRQLCLIDPICFAMFMPNLLRNFLYESPNSGSWLGDFMMVSAARDLHVSATLSRRFFWSDVNLFEEQLPPDTLVVLSGRDALMAASQVRSWLEQHTQAVMMYHPDLAHAGFLLDISWQQQILQQLLILLDNKGSSRSTSAAAAVGKGGHHGNSPAPAVASNGQQPGALLGGGKEGEQQQQGHSHVNGGSSSNLLGSSLGAPQAGGGGSGAQRAAHAAAAASAAIAAAVAEPLAVEGRWYSQHLNGSTSTSSSRRISNHSDSDSQRSYTSCEEQSRSWPGGFYLSDNSSSSNNNSAQQRPSALTRIDQQQLMSAVAASQPSPFSTIDGVDTRPDGSSSSAGVSDIASPCTPASSLKLGSSLGSLNINNSMNNVTTTANNSSSSQLLAYSSGQLLPAWPPMRSREGSLELMSSPLCMRSWSGVLPVSAGAVGAPAAPTDVTSTTSAAEESSPRSCNTFVSATSVQSARSARRQSAAQQATQAAHMLLQPLLAMQQHTRQQQHSRQRAKQQQQQQAQEDEVLVGAEAAAECEQPSDVTREEEQQQHQPQLLLRRRHTWHSPQPAPTLPQDAVAAASAAGVNCMVICSPTADDKAAVADTHNVRPHAGAGAKAAAAAAGGDGSKQLAAGAAEGPRGLLGLRARRVGGAGGSGGGGCGVSVGAGVSDGAGGSSVRDDTVKRPGVFRRVEGLLQGRQHTKGGGAAAAAAECS